MRNLFLIVTGVLALAAPDRAPAAERPNVVVILSDDQAWTDYGFMGHPDIKTPHLDKLAGQSVVFERGYVAAPLCRPSLASMVTGRYPFDHGITGNDVDGNNNRAALDLPLREAFNQLPGFIRGLTADGYLTHQSGKWWEGSFKDGGFTHGMTHADPERGGRHGDAGLVIGREGLKPISDFLDAKARKERDTVFGVCHSVHNMTPGRPDDTLRYLWCVSGDWKLLVRHEGEDTTEYKNIHLWDVQPVRLYNLKDDPHEKNELSGKHPDIVDKLRKKIEAWHSVASK
jgi:arylsulfatase A-like enzyme